jgi:hypothetical protein
MRGPAQLGFALTQPLLSGAGYLSASETLTQGERTCSTPSATLHPVSQDLRRGCGHAVFPGDPGPRERAKNAYLGFKAFNVVERETAMQKENLRAPSPRCIVCSQHASCSTAAGSTRCAITSRPLDDLKIQLGLPVTESIVLDYKDMHEFEIIDPTGSLDEALTTALTAAGPVEHTGRVSRTPAAVC